MSKWENTQNKITRIWRGEEEGMYSWLGRQKRTRWYVQACRRQLLDNEVFLHNVSRHDGVLVVLIQQLQVVGSLHFQVEKLKHKESAQMKISYPRSGTHPGLFESRF